MLRAPQKKNYIVTFIEKNNFFKDEFVYLTKEEIINLKCL